jgi:hypothetical protein
LGLRALHALRDDLEMHAHLALYQHSFSLVVAEIKDREAIDN